jgi:chaperonin GroES
VRSLQDDVLIRRIEAEAKTLGGIIIPDAAQPRRAESPPPGPARATRQPAPRPGVKPGSRVLFGKLSGTQITLDGRDLIMMKKADIVGVVEKSAAKKKAA